MTDNAARMSYNPPSASARPVSGPVEPPAKAHDDGSAWRDENGKRSIERSAANSR